VEPEEQIAAARRGDRDAFAALVRSLQKPVFGLCARLLRTPAEAAEVTQETFLRAYQNLHRYDARRPFDVWVLTIARNLCLDALRRRVRGDGRTQELDPVSEAIPSPAPTAEQVLVDTERRGQLEAALRTLSVEDRAVLTLYYSQNRSTKQIAEVLNVAPGTVMARLFRAREKLRKLMPQAGEP
jgi:RNA polymerase sigma-70 factor (ECF subfamily)